MFYLNFLNKKKKHTNVYTFLFLVVLVNGAFINTLFCSVNKNSRNKQKKKFSSFGLKGFC